MIRLFLGTNIYEPKPKLTNQAAKKYFLRYKTKVRDTNEQFFKIYTCCNTVNLCGCFTLHGVLYDCSRVGSNEIVIIHNNSLHYCFIDFMNVSLFV